MIPRTHPRFVGVLLLAIWMTGCDGGASVTRPREEHRTPVPEPEHVEGVVELAREAAITAGIETAPVERRPFAAVLETTGQVGFDETSSAEVGPRLAGRVVDVAAELGARVAAGEPLSRIDSIELGEAKAAYLRARARSELARENSERERDLFADRISSRQELLTAQAEWRQAEADRQAAAATLELYGLSSREVQALSYDDPAASVYVLRAPFAGTVIEREVTRGELVTPEDRLFLIADLSRVWIWIDVFERDLQRVHLEDTVEVAVDALPGRAFAGEVGYLAARVDPETRTVRARIDVGNPEKALKPGMFARIRLADPHGESQGREVVAVPETAVQRDGEESIIFVAASDDRYARREVTTGRRAEGWIEILSGLEAGERVVTRGAFTLKSEASKEKLGGGHGH